MNAVVLTADKERGAFLKLQLICAGIRRCDACTTAENAVDSAVRSNAAFILLERGFLARCRSHEQRSRRALYKYIILDGAEAGKAGKRRLGCDVLGCVSEPVVVEEVLELAEASAQGREASGPRRKPPGKKAAGTVPRPLVPALTPTAAMLFELRPPMVNARRAWWKLHSVASAKTYSCGDMGEAMLLMDKLCEELQINAEGGQELALLASRRNKPCTGSTRKGYKGVFIINVRYRMHGSMQGQVLWLRDGTKKECFFRSAVELMKLISSVVDSDNNP